MSNPNQKVIPITANVEVKVFDKNGILIAQETKEADLLTINSSHHLFCAIIGGSSNVFDETGMSKGISNEDVSYGYGYNYFTQFFKQVYKIAIGLDDTAPAYTDFKLVNKHAETTSVTYGACLDKDTYSEFSVQATITLSIEKIIKEVGLFGRSYRYGNAITFVTPDVWWLSARDVLSPSVTVPAGSSITIKYTFRVGLPP